MRSWQETLDILQSIIEDGNYVGGLSTQEINNIFTVLLDNVPFIEDSVPFIEDELPFVTEDK